MLVILAVTLLLVSVLQLLLKALLVLASLQQKQMLSLAVLGLDHCKPPVRLCGRVRARA